MDKHNFVTIANLTKEKVELFAKIKNIAYYAQIDDESLQEQVIEHQQQHTSQEAPLLAYGAENEVGLLFRDGLGFLRRFRFLRRFSLLFRF